MKKSLIAFVSVLCAAESFLFSRGKQDLVPAGSWVYDALASICIERGKTDFSFRAPLSIEEISLYLSDVDYEELSDAGKMQLARIEKYFGEEHASSFGSDILKLSADYEMNAEAYYKSEDDIDWIYDRYERKPLLFIPFALTLDDYATVQMDLKIGQNKGRMMEDDDFCNVPLVVDDFDLNFPSNAYLCTGKMITDGTGITFKLGMGEGYFNRSLSGSVAESEYFTGSAYGSLALYSKNLRYEMKINQFNVDKFMYTHELGFILFDKLQITLRESLLAYSSMELRYMVPLSIYHGLSPWRDYGTDDETQGGESHTCDYMALKFDFTPCRSLRTYGVVVMNQFQMPNESSDENDTTPSSLGYQLGAESFVPAGDGYLHFWLEGTYTEPYMYIKGSPNWSLCRAYLENVSPSRNDPIYEWYGTPWEVGS